MGLHGVVCYPLPVVLWLSGPGADVSGLVSPLLFNRFLQLVSCVWVKGWPVHPAWPGLSGGGSVSVYGLLDTLAVGGT